MVIFIGNVTPENNKDKDSLTVQEIMANIEHLQGPGLVNNIRDKRTGKTYATLNALLNDYGYALEK